MDSICLPLLFLYSNERLLSGPASYLTGMYRACVLRATSVKATVQPICKFEFGGFCWFRSDFRFALLWAAAAIADRPMRARVTNFIERLHSVTISHYWTLA